MLKTKTSTTIILSLYERKIAEYIGHIRRQTSIDYERENTRRDFTNDGLVNDIEAVGAEIAVAKYLNIYPEWSPTVGEVPQHDLKWYGRKLDVKSTQRQDGNLLIPFLDIDLIYFFVRGVMPHYEIVGSIEGRDVEARGKWVNPGKFFCWLVTPGKLEL